MEQVGERERPMRRRQRRHVVAAASLGPKRTVRVFFAGPWAFLLPFRSLDSGWFDPTWQPLLIAVSRSTRFSFSAGMPGFAIGVTSTVSSNTKMHLTTDTAGKKSSRWGPA